MLPSEPGGYIVTEKKTKQNILVYFSFKFLSRLTRASPEFRLNSRELLLCATNAGPQSRERADKLNTAKSFQRRPLNYNSRSLLKVSQFRVVSGPVGAYFFHIEKIEATL